MDYIDKEKHWENFQLNCALNIVSKIEDDIPELYFFLRQISYNRKLLTALLARIKTHTIDRVIAFAYQMGDQEFANHVRHHQIAAENSPEL